MDILKWLAARSPSEWISAGSLIVAALAYRRAGKVRILDRRLELRRDLADLRPRLEALLRGIPMAVQSRTNAASASVGALSGAVQSFRESADADMHVMRGLLDELDGVGRLPLLTTHARLESKLVAARGVRTRFDQLASKYAAAAAEDDEMRRRRHQEVLLDVDRMLRT